MSAVEKFPVLLSEAEDESSAVPPCFSHEGINVRDEYFCFRRILIILDVLEENIHNLGFVSRTS